MDNLAQIQNDSYVHFQQTPFWCYFKAAHGWRYLQIGDMAVLVRSFMHGIFSIAYVPMYPKLNPAIENSAITLTHKLTEIAKSIKSSLPRNTICVRFDPAVDFYTPGDRDEYVNGAKLVAFADKLPLSKSAVDIQPPDTTIIDLKKSEDELLSTMKSKWRYNINLSRRKGVVIEKYTGDSSEISKALDVFYEIYKITASRDGIALHSKDYYSDLFNQSSISLKKDSTTPIITLYLAKHEEDYLAGIITLFSKSESVYLYGASSDIKRNLMPNFLLQWTAIFDAKNYGSNYYDLYGMPPTGDENHPMHGLYQFKTGFMGQNTHRIGSWDVRLNLIYKVFAMAEKARAFYHKKFLKKVRRR